MSSKILVIKPSKILYEDLIGDILSNESYDLYQGQSLRDRRLLFLVSLDDIGYDLDFIGWIKSLKDGDLKGAVAGMIIMSPTEYHTKSMAQDIILHLNRLGLAFIGHSVLEVVKDCKNFETWQKTIRKSLTAIAIDHGKQLLYRLESHETRPMKNIVALHASSHKTSNTLGLWRLVSNYLLETRVKEIHIENGTVVDCKGCPFQTCIHFGKYHSCFYGGVMVEEVLPAIEVADVIVWICPNYNDAVSANMMAVINRLTVLYRQMSFHDKACYAVVVSGNSGSDSVTKQLIGALNINKGFKLPPYFSIMATANDPLKVLEIEGIDKKAKKMANDINIFCQNFGI